MKLFANAWIKSFLLLPVISAIGFANADPLKSLYMFMHNQHAEISANFTQTVFGKRKNQVSTGKLKIMRPNRFIWAYDNQGQQIICNGKTLYIYDPMLEQVTVKQINGALGKSPALLLAGNTDIKKLYKITVEPSVAGLEWVRLIPKNSSDSNGFQSIDMGFNPANHDLSMMQFKDAFGNESQVKFNQLNTHAKFLDSDFNFKVTKDMDVIGSQ